ncbi:MAG: hypothetical protein OEU36_22030 [Gammaproteobacteria bacterium]|nr:hypothetical protein [Gammaproteobacteria bacterium]
MSAIVCVFNRGGAPVNEDEVQLLLERLDHHGPDGRGVQTGGPLGIGFQHFWTTPEEVSVIQPIHDRANDILFAFEGRIDNRDELMGELRRGSNDNTISDVHLAINAYKKWGEAAFSRIVGPFVFVVADTSRQKITIARDAL